MNGRYHWQRFLAVFAFVTAGCLMAGERVAAQDAATSETEPAASATENDASAKTPPKRAFRGRLPAYFSAVVNLKQRQEIYTLQAEYHDKIAALLDQIEELKNERDKAVDDVLTTDQLAAVQQKRDEAAARRAERQAKAESKEGSER
jgi:hypothetical protein